MPFFGARGVGKERIGYTMEASMVRGYEPKTVTQPLFEWSRIRAASINSVGLGAAMEAVRIEEEESVGWPFLCMYWKKDYGGRLEYGKSIDGIATIELPATSAEYMNSKFGEQYKDTTFGGEVSLVAAHKHVLALWPIPIPLALNSGIYAIASLGLFWALRAVRGRFRMRNGSCPECGYELLYRFGEGCSECGWNKPLSKAASG
jgi:hypothetical protein